MDRMKSGCFLMMVLLALCGTLLLDPPSSRASAPEGTLKQAIHFGISADWLDPATAGFVISSQLPLYLLHDSLIKAMPEGTFVPCLAESWTVSPDARVYEFKLRKGAKFHNGDPVTAEDVVYSFWRYKANQAKFIHDKTAKVEALNPLLVRIQFKEPFADFLEYFVPGVSSIGWVVPKKYVEKVGDAGFKKNPIGAGPYKFVEFVTGVRLVGEAFEGYWRKVPNIKRMEFHIIAEAATRLTMAKRGEVDIASLMQGVYYEDLRKDPKLRMLAPMSATQWILYFTSQWDPKSPWSDPRVRKAASLAIDRQTLADIHMPGCGPIGALGMEEEYPTVKFSPDRYDPEGAKKLLAEAGYPKGFHGGKFYPFQGGYWPYGEQVANYLKAVGISLETVLLDRPAFLAQRAGGKMKGGLFIDSIAAPTIGGRLTYLFGTSSYGNYPDIQGLWDQYQREISPKGRKELVAQIQKRVQERIMWIPLTSTSSPAAVGPKVKGNPYRIQPIIWFAAPFEDIELQ